MSGSERRNGMACASTVAMLASRSALARSARRCSPRQAVGPGDDGDGLVAASRRRQDAPDQPVELSVVEQMGLLGQLGQRRDVVLRSLEQQGKDLIAMHQGRIGLREQLEQGRHVPFGDRLLLGIVWAPGTAGRHRLLLRGQTHPERARNAVADRGTADVLQHAILNCAVPGKLDSRRAGQRGLLPEYRACGTREGLGEVLVVAARGDPGLGIAVFELECARDHLAGHVAHDLRAGLLGQKPDLDRRIRRLLAHDMDTSVPADDGRVVRHFPRRRPQRDVEPGPRERQPRGEAEGVYPRKARTPA